MSNDAITVQTTRSMEFDGVRSIEFRAGVALQCPDQQYQFMVRTLLHGKPVLIELVNLQQRPLVLKARMRSLDGRTELPAHTRLFQIQLVRVVPFVVNVVNPAAAAAAAPQAPVAAPAQAAPPMQVQ